MFIHLFKHLCAGPHPDSAKTIPKNYKNVFIEMTAWAET